MLAFHDADIVTYDRAMMVRLLYMVVHLRYQLAKAYYARFWSGSTVAWRGCFIFRSSKRCTKCWAETISWITWRTSVIRYRVNSRPFLNCQRNAVSVRLGHRSGYPLRDVPHRADAPFVCQVEITPRYDHKHQQVGTDIQGGLLRMVADIARAFYTKLASGGAVPRRDFLVTLKHTYMTNARAFVRVYEAVAEMNKVERLDAHEKLKSIESFAGVLEHAFQEFQEHPSGSPMIPEWRRIEAALEGICPNWSACSRTLWANRPDSLQVQFRCHCL